MGKHGERFGFAVLMFQLRKICFAGLILTEEEHRRFRKGPAQGHVANLLACESRAVSRWILWRTSPGDKTKQSLAHGETRDVLDFIPND